METKKYIKIQDLEVYKLARLLSKLAWEIYNFLDMKEIYRNIVETHRNIVFLFISIYFCIFLCVSILFLLISNTANAATINRPPSYLSSNNGLAPLEVQYADSVSAVAFGDRLLTGLVGYLPHIID